jgi:conjugal transfer/entry exclusion protein
MKDLTHIKRFNESEENLNISDVMNRIYDLLDEHKNLKKEMEKSDEELNYTWTKLSGRKLELEKVFQVLGIKYVS